MGIGVGVGVAGIILLAGLWRWCIVVRRKRDKRGLNERGTLAGRSEPMDPAMVQEYQQQQQRDIGTYYDQQQQQQGNPLDKRVSSVTGRSGTTVASPQLSNPESPHFAQPGMHSGYPPGSEPGMYSGYPPGPEPGPASTGIYNEYAQGYLHGVHSALAQVQAQAQRSPPGHEIPRFAGAPRLGSEGSGGGRWIEGGELRGSEVVEIDGDNIVRSERESQR